jgi:phospholipid/cholesterol/gamma-HCH transport system substrate-binding protein
VITRKTKLQLLAFVVVALLGISYVGFKYVGLDRLLLGTGYTVSADFTDSGGIFPNAEVTYRGVTVGRVSDLRLVDKGVRVVMTMDPGSDRIPASARAVVADRSAVGEQYVDLEPPDDRGPFLTDGSVIPMDRTAVPIPVEKLLIDSDQLARSIDTQNLRVVVDELGKAFNGTGDSLGRLIDSGNLLLGRAQQSLPRTQQLIVDGQTVLDTQVAHRSDIQTWAADLKLVTDTLVQEDPDLRTLVVNAPDAGAAVQQLVQSAGPGLGSLVRNLDILNGVTIPRIPGIEQLLVTYPDVVSGGFSVVRNDSGVMRAHFGFALNMSQPRVCTTGYLSTGSTPSPAAVAAADVSGVRCDVVNGVDPNPGDGVDETGSDIRGAQNIGRTGGVGTPAPGGSGTPAPPTISSTVVDQTLAQLLGATPFSQVLG